MQTMRIRIFLVLFVLVLSYPSSLIAATERRIALVIGNGAYSSGPLKNPANDATDMAAALKRAGFTVTLKRNANLQEMVETIEAFGNSLKRGGVGLFYYAGHGVQVNSVNYLLPIGARINKESDVRFQAVDAGRILAEMETANNSLNIVILDACRDNPFGKSFRSTSRGLAIVTNAPSGTFISYSTGAGQVASDGEGKNSPYARALLENIAKPGLTINKVFMNVRSKVKKETGQIPWELSSLEGDFYFIPGSPEKSVAMVPSGRATVKREESSVSTTEATDNLDDENRRLEAEQRLIEEEKAALEAKERQALEREALMRKKQEKEEKKVRDTEVEQLTVELRKIKLEMNQLAMAKSPSQTKVVEIGKDGRFIAYNDGTVLDTKTKLMWAAKDNGIAISHADAKEYCEKYRGGGYTDWRIPSQGELLRLYDRSVGYAPKCVASGDKDKVHLTNFITLSCWYIWGIESLKGDRGYADFINGKDYWANWMFGGSGEMVARQFRVLPVRDYK